MSRWLSRGLKIFLFYWLTICLGRVVFILCMQDYWNGGTGWQDVLTALWLGSRLSIQTAGILMLVTAVPAALVCLVSENWSRKLAKFLSGTILSATSILFVASFPYYRQFHSKFNQVMFNAPNDDMAALLVSLVLEFWLPLRLAAALLLAYGLYRLLHYFLQWKSQRAARMIFVSAYNRRHKRKYAKAAAWLAGMYVLGRLVVFGGSWGWETALEWENIGVTNDGLLNEAVLDDYQAVYRGYCLNSRFLACNGLDFTPEQIQQLAGELTGKAADSRDLQYYLQRQAQGAQVPQPQQIFVIVSESYANWPLLEKYSQLHIADGMKGIIAGEDAAYCGAMLPNGSSTISAMTGIATGLADANLYLTTMKQSFAQPYLTALAPQMEQLGYATAFWYAGPESWERIGAFTQAQGFRNFYGRGDMPEEATGSVWGCDDEYLYSEVLRRVSPNEASFNVILNVSNHSPYTVDVEAKGFPAEKVRQSLPEKAREDDWLLKELGHYWYADREMTAFIGKLKEKYPQCLIVVMGDHGDRYNIEKTPSMYEQYAIPFIVTGNGVHRNILPKGCAGSQIDVGATIIEMIAPAGFTYYSLGSSLSRGNNRGVNYGFWINSDYIGEADKFPLEPLPLPDSQGSFLDDAAMQRYIDAIRGISWWLPKYGTLLDEDLMAEDE